MLQKNCAGDIVGKRVVCVGRLTASVSDNGLRDLCNQYGTVARESVILDGRCLRLYVTPMPPTPPDVEPHHQ
ncbi:hypothetical protein NITLEN_90089 [Nitrospira lenta]|uniref:RNA-binding protein n=1 Tax=Nitrospira lenta TaxID=1436998 RepID=A0A330LAV3_9BACT|nr:hypothetical protein NITLEN_90089 [Nitrospira lenta]